MKKKIIVIANPFSGTGSKENLKSLMDEYLDHSRFEYELFYTSYPGHAKELAAEAVSEGVFMCVAAGGDGTVNEVASSLVGSGVILAVLPYGSGNGFAAHIGIKRDVIKGIHTINSGEVHKVDSCKANDRFFLNIAGIGLDATVAFKTKTNKKRGFLPYFITTLKESLDFRYMNLDIQTDTRELSGEFAMVVVANASIYGYDFTIAPTANLEDGLLDILIVKKAPVYKYFFMALRVLNKSFHKSPLVEFMRVKKLSIVAKKKAFIHVDGEGFEAENTTVFTIVPGSLKVIFPVNADVGVNLYKHGK